MILLVTGYLPSVILQLFLYAVPPIMMLFSTLEGPTSHSERKKSSCRKVLYFLIWNVFFVSLASGTIINQLNSSSSTKDIAVRLASVIPGQVSSISSFMLQKDHFVYGRSIVIIYFSFLYISNTNTVIM
jgi:hypothetical protein